MKYKILEKTTYLFMILSPLFALLTILFWGIFKLLNLNNNSIIFDLFYIFLFTSIGLSISFLLLFIITYFYKN
jgi:hypothetical protein